MPFHYERHGCSQLLGFVRPKWQRRSGAASGSFGDDARNLLRLRFVSPKLSRGHSYLSLGFVRPQRHLVLAERGALAERVGLLGDPRVRLAEIACVGLRRLGFVRRNFAAAAGTPWARSAKIFQIALLRVPEKAGDPPKLFIHFGVRVRIRVWQTRQAGLIATAASSTMAPPQSHIV